MNTLLKVWISPGTPSTLLFERPRDILSEKFDEWPFLTVHFWGEKAVGTWRLVVTNSGSRAAHQPGERVGTCERTRKGQGEDGGHGDWYGG